MNELDPRQFRYGVSSGTATVTNVLTQGDRVLSITLKVDALSPATGVIHIRRFPNVAPQTVAVAIGETICLHPEMGSILEVFFTLAGGAIGKWLVEYWTPVTF